MMLMAIIITIISTLLTVVANKIILAPQGTSTNPWPNAHKPITPRPEVHYKSLLCFGYAAI
jgi:hypothetical protein